MNTIASFAEPIPTIPGFAADVNTLNNGINTLIAAKGLSRIKEVDQDLRERFLAYQAKAQHSLGVLAHKLGSSEGYISKYINNVFEGNVPKFERAVSDLLKSVELRDRLIGDIETFPTIVTHQISRFLDLVRRNSHVGLIWGDAGIGKSRALEIYFRKNRLTIHITASRCAGANASGVQNSIWQQIDNSTYSHRKHGSKGAFLIEKLGGSGRLITVDNAHRLTAKAREWLFDFQDATGCPIALIGNPEVLDAIRINDQQFSRIGLKLDVSLTDPNLKKDTTPQVVDKMIGEIWPEAAAEIRNVAIQVATQHGHLRALFHQLRVAVEFFNSGISANPLAAFRAAHTQLVRNYKLTA